MVVWFWVFDQGLNWASNSRKHLGHSISTQCNEQCAKFETEILTIYDYIFESDSLWFWQIVKMDI